MPTITHYSSSFTPCSYNNRQEVWLESQKSPLATPTDTAPARCYWPLSSSDDSAAGPSAPCGHRSVASTQECGPHTATRRMQHIITHMQSSQKDGGQKVKRARFTLSFKLLRSLSQRHHTSWLWLLFLVNFSLRLTFAYRSRFCCLPFCWSQRNSRQKRRSGIPEDKLQTSNLLVFSPSNLIQPWPYLVLPTHSS